MSNITLGVDTGSLDMDQENHIFFMVLTKNWPGKVVLFSLYGHTDAADRSAKERKYHFDEVVDASGNDFVNLLRKHNVRYYFSAYDEIIKKVPAGIWVLKVLLSPPIVERQRKQSEELERLGITF